MNKNKLMEIVKQRALENLGKLASEYPKAKTQDREAIMAGIEFEREIAGCCDFYNLEGDNLPM